MEHHSLSVPSIFIEKYREIEISCLFSRFDFYSCEYNFDWFYNVSSSSSTSSFRICVHVWHTKNKPFGNFYFKMRNAKVRFFASSFENLDLSMSVWTSDMPMLTDYEMRKRWQKKQNSKWYIQWIKSSQKENIEKTMNWEKAIAAILVKNSSFHCV